MQYRIGTSGWSYKHWSGDFYPEDLPASQWLEYYARRFGTVEVNSSFYRLPSEKMIESWRNRAPPGFTYTFKVSRYITHVLRFRDSADALSTFIDRCSAVGAEHLGAFLYQTPPDVHKDLDLLEGFLALLSSGWQHVFEFRHASWFADDAIGLLRQYRVGFCVHDHGNIGCPVVATGPVAYFRFHGDAETYSGSYDDQQLAGWSDRIQSLGEDVEIVYAYFNNDIHGHAVRNARTLREMIAR